MSGLANMEVRCWRIESLAIVGMRACIDTLGEIVEDDHLGERVYGLQHQFEMLAELAKALGEELEIAQRAAA